MVHVRHQSHPSMWIRGISSVRHVGRGVLERRIHFAPVTGHASVWTGTS